MKQEFNIAGPCNPTVHYMLPPERRLGEVLELIESHKYFMISGGWQTGKTTCAQWLQQHLNATGQWRAMWVDLQTAREQPDPAKGFRTILNKLTTTHKRVHPDIPLLDPEPLLQDPATALVTYLKHLSESSDRPWVIFFDEADGLVGETMVLFLTQLRDGYLDRFQQPFPASVVLVGRRQVRDFVVRAEDRHAIAWLGTSSPFNINAEAMTLAAFTAAEVEELLLQHTAKTGQRFEPEAIALIYELGQGHPWLTNALADQIVRHDLKDRSLPITAAHVEAAKETIILERRSHIDSLIARLREERVRRVLDPMIAGTLASNDVVDDDFSYVLGLGLIRKIKGQYQAANPIYSEVIPRTLNNAQQYQIWNKPLWYVRNDGSLDMEKLMTDWQAFWRKDGHVAAAGFDYRESGPHLMMMAFLQRVINGGGQIHREYGLGRGALDLLVEWKGARHAIELKIRRSTNTEPDALAQLGQYLEHLGLSEGWLILFDRRKGLKWDKKLYQRDVDYHGKRIRLVGS
ncbi:MAG TPA: ATP-binding protein [Polyangium sp.]|nr:ATP-binding protein [Polyangium sp.]